MSSVCARRPYDHSRAVSGARCRAHATSPASPAGTWAGGCVFGQLRDWGRRCTAPALRRCANADALATAPRKIPSWEAPLRELLSDPNASAAVDQAPAGHQARQGQGPSGGSPPACSGSAGAGASRCMSRVHADPEDPQRPRRNRRPGPCRRHRRRRRLPTARNAAALARPLQAPALHRGLCAHHSALEPEAAAAAAGSSHERRARAAAYGGKGLLW